MFSAVTLERSYFRQIYTNKLFDVHTCTFIHSAIKYIKWMDTCIKTRVLTSRCGAGCGEEGVMEDINKAKCGYKVDGNIK